MSELVQDIAFAWRAAVGKPASALLIVLTLALGIGANTAMFSMTWHVLLAPLPYAEGDRLVTLRQSEPGGGREDFGWSNPTVRDFREQSSVFDDLLAYNQWSLTFVGHGEPWHGAAGLVTGSFFETLGVRAALGRTLSPDDEREGAEPVLLLSQEFWRGKFGGDPAVIGKTLEIQHSVYRIVGVLPSMPAYPHANDVWIPMASNPYDLAGVGVNDSRGASVIARVIGKLREGVPLAEARGEAAFNARRLAAEYPDDYAADYTVELIPLKEELIADASLTILLLMGLAVVVVLIACANVANLQLARTAARHQELAIREAVGASPQRVARQLLTESVLLALAGALLGLLIAWPCLALLADFAARYTPLASEIGMDGTVLAFSSVLALLTGVFSSAASAFGRRDINKALKEGGDRVTTAASGVRRRNVLLAMQFALAFTVLCVAAVIILSLTRLNRQDVGFDMDRVLAVNMTLNVDLTEPAQIGRKMRDFTRSALEAVRALPEVNEAAIRTGAPLLEEIASETAFTFGIEDWPEASFAGEPSASLNMISGNYFALMDIPLLQGRPFTLEDDGDAAPVAIVNESFARRYFPDGDAIGRSVRLRGHQEWRTVVGVVADVRSADIDRLEGPVAYYSYWQFPIEGVNLYVRTAAGSARVAAAIADTVHRLDPRQSVLVRPLDELKSARLAPARLRATMISLFGLLALMVTLSGVVGVVSCNIGQRVRELGIHMSVGATPAQVTGMFIADGLKVFSAGLALGLALMLAAAPLLQPLLYQTEAVDAGVYLLSALVLALAVLAAIWVPARRAGAMRPMAALQ